nr:MAG: RNA-dependent RNA polymerase [Totiviridae sp.]
MGSALFGTEPPDCLEDLYRANTTLLPERWLRPWTAERVADTVRRRVVPVSADVPERPPDWDDLLLTALRDFEDDRNVVAAFPPRTPQDLGIRHVRASDVWSFYVNTGRRDELEACLRLLKAFDYVAMVNILLARILIGGDVWWSTLERAGCFAAGAEHFRLSARALSDLMKKENVALPPDDRVSFYEVASLYGAMCPPVPGWDPVDKTRELAHGGADAHGLILGQFPDFDNRHFLAAIGDLACVPPHSTPDVRDFVRWLWDEEWARSGAASLGYVEYELDDEEGQKRGRFKARKNLILDVIPFDELVARALSYRRQDNVALIKTELSKIRLAVSSPVETYLGQAWLFAVCGHAYLGWPGNTLEEPKYVEMARLETTWLRLRGGEYSLPYDFAEFDHQPTSSEVLAFQDCINRGAQRQALPSQRPHMDTLTSCLLDGFRAATLTSPPGLGPQATFKVTGGLMSGLRSTSCVGSGWNSLFGEFARKMAEVVRGSREPCDVWQVVRGDDTQVVGQSYHDVLVIKVGYDALGAKANESKFTLRRGRTEFLRVETEDRLRGYPCRSIPLVTQRRPWNARPVRHEAGLEHVLKTLATLRRRLPRTDGVDAFREHFVRRSFRLLRLDPRLRTIPLSLGGLGVDPWDGQWMVHSWRQIDPPRIRITNKTDFREQKVAEEFAGAGVDVTPEEVSALAERRIRAKVAADDVPAFAGIVRRIGRTELQARRFVKAGIRRDRLHNTMAEMGALAAVVANLPPSQGSYSRLSLHAASAVKTHAPDWASERHQIEQFNRLSELARLRGCPLGPLLRAEMPDFARKLSRVERRYKLRRSAAVDFVLGQMSGTDADRLPSPLPNLLGQFAAATLGLVTAVMRTATPVEATYVFQHAYDLFAKAAMSSGYARVFLTN